MSFFTTSTGENAASNATGEFQVGGGDFECIPKDTRVVAVCDEAKIVEYQNSGDKLINLKWTIARPAEYKNRVVFQKIRCWEKDTQKADKAKRMLAAIDANAGGKLAERFAKGEEPTDLNLQMCLTAKPMVLMLDIWKKSKDENGNDIPKNMQPDGGNYVKAVSKYDPSAKKAEAPKPASAPKPAPAPQSTGTIDIDDDIPFAPMAHTRAMMLAM